MQQITQWKSSDLHDKSGKNALEGRMVMVDGIRAAEAGINSVITALNYVSLW